MPAGEILNLKRLYPKQPLVGVGAIIICKGRILLEKRKNEPGKGKWSIPGGKVELGEKCEETVVREVKEETGLTVTKPEHIGVVDNIELDDNGRVKYHFVIIDFFVTLKGGTLRASSDAAELKWVPLKEVGKYTLTKTFREFYRRNYEKLAAMESYS
jgi:8-oxo-dGTP diphosphatase